MRSYALSDFDYSLPGELIAQTPAAERAASRLLHLDGATLTDLTFAGLTRLLNPGDLLVFNDTRVIKSRLHGVKPTGGKVELLLERIVGSREGLFQLRASHPPRVGGVVDLPGGARAFVARRNDRLFNLLFEGVESSLLEYLDHHGEVPLPRYIARAAAAADETRYQTVYARHPGAVAAPTAGLHFDDAMLAALHAAGIAFCYLTLHVGAGTFQPMQSEDLAAHRMHSEWYRIPLETANAVAATRSRGGCVVAVGTTSLRALESAAGTDGQVKHGDAETALFITPGFRFHIVDRLLTNFHLPKSTLLVLVSAFAGHDAIRMAYEHAIRQRYRFFSYGDAMLLECEAVADSG